MSDPLERAVEEAAHQAQLDHLRAALAEAREVIRFYADRAYWDENGACRHWRPDGVPGERTYDFGDIARAFLERAK